MKEAVTHLSCVCAKKKSLMSAAKYDIGAGSPTSNLQASAFCLQPLRLSGTEQKGENHCQSKQFPWIVFLGRSGNGASVEVADKGTSVLRMMPKEPGDIQNCEFLINWTHNYVLTISLDMKLVDIWTQLGITLSFVIIRYSIASHSLFSVPITPRPTIPQF